MQRSQAVIGTQHLNNKGLVDVKCIHNLFESYQSALMREECGLTFDQVEQEFQVAISTDHLEILKLTDVSLQEVCTVTTELSLSRGIGLAFKQHLIKRNHTEAYICFQLIHFVKNGRLDSIVARALLERQKIQAK